MFNSINKSTSITKIAIWTSIAFISNLVLKLYTVPKIRSFTEGMTSFDLRIMGYDNEYVMTYLSKLSQEAVNFYKYVQIPFDIVFPVTTAIAAFYIFSFLNRKLRVKKVLFLLPIVVCILDLTENLFIFLFLSDIINSTTVYISSLLTRMKFLFGITYGLILTVLILRYRFLVKRKK